MIIGEEPIGEKNVLALPACKLKKVLALLSTFGGKTQFPAVSLLPHYYYLITSYLYSILFYSMLHDYCRIKYMRVS